MHVDLQHFNSAITMSNRKDQSCTPANPLWIWSGQHGVSGIVHPFLAVRDDPNQCYSGLGDDRENLILAGSGGLLLIKRSPDHNQTSQELRQRWQSLMVVNPSTHESRVLPPANSMYVGLEFWSYNGVQANLLTNTKFQTYTVTLTFPDYVCLYSSTSNAWKCRNFNQGAPWGPYNTEFWAKPWSMQIASAYVNGRLFFADVVEDPFPTMNLIEIDAEAGSWKLHNWHYSLQTLFTEFVDTPFLRMRGLTNRGMNQALNTQTLASHRRGWALGTFQIVECMGELYAIIPMSLTEYLPMSLRSQRTLTEVVHEYANFHSSFMPLQFMIVSMRGDGFVHGVLRILLPEDKSSAYVGSNIHIGNEVRKNELKSMLGQRPGLLDGFIWNLSCVAEGSVICVGLLDYVLQYDVVTGVSKTEIIGKGSRQTSLEIWVNRAPYRPSDMKP